MAMRARILAAFEARGRGDVGPLEALVAEPPANPTALSANDFRNDQRRHYFSSMKRRSIASTCIAPSCVRAPIGSHLIHQACLAHIESAGHIVWFEMSPDPEQPVATVEDEVGVRKFTQFAGFCSTHDHGLFEPIDRADPAVLPTKAEMVLWHYRSAACAYRHVEDHLERMFPLLIKVLDLAADRWLRRETLIDTLRMYQSAQELVGWVECAARFRKPGRDQKLVTVTAMLPRHVPLAAAGFCTPWWDAITGRPFASKGTPSLTFVVVPGPRCARIIMVVPRPHWRTFQPHWAALRPQIEAGETEMLLRYVVSTPIMMGVGPRWWGSLTLTEQETWRMAVEAARSGLRPARPGALPRI